VATTARFGLASAIGFTLSLFIASSCRADQYTYGTWEGFESVTTTVTTVFGEQLSQTTESFDATLTIQFYAELPNAVPMQAYLYMVDVDISGPASLSSYGADGLSGFLYQDMYPSGFQFVDFDAIPGYADATYTGQSQDIGGTYNITTVNAFFQTVPEPSAFAEGVLAIASLSVFGCARRLVAS
jgi:hypothetical protein